jgi:hypothetical protein
LLFVDTIYLAFVTFSTVGLGDLVQDFSDSEVTVTVPLDVYVSKYRNIQQVRYA